MQRPQIQVAKGPGATHARALCYARGATRHAVDGESGGLADGR